MNSRLVISALEADGWFKVAQKDDHVQFKRPTKPGRVTVRSGRSKSIERQSGLKLR